MIFFFLFNYLTFSFNSLLPFLTKNRHIVGAEIDWDELCDVVSDECADFVSRLLIADPAERLGAGGSQDVMIFFDSFYEFHKNN